MTAHAFEGGAGNLADDQRVIGNVYWNFIFLFGFGMIID